MPFVTFSFCADFTPVPAIIDKKDVQVLLVLDLSSAINLSSSTHW
jgi:hypothetical protein